MKRIEAISEISMCRDTAQTRRGVTKTIGACLAALAAALIGASVDARAGTTARGEINERASTTQSLATLRYEGSLAKQYCESARDAISEARFAQQSAHLEHLAKQLDERLATIEKRSAELKEWIAKRDSFIATATNHLVGIFSAMRPESASEQLVRLEPLTAAAILSRLDVRAASAILNDMPPEKAARLTAVMVGSARRDGQENP